MTVIVVDPAPFAAIVTVLISLMVTVATEGAPLVAVSSWEHDEHSPVVWPVWPTVSCNDDG